MNEKRWVDFTEVKAAVSMTMILEYYQINWLRKSKDQLRGRCPIHDGEGDRAFHVSLTKEAFNCFSCGAKGNVLDFVAAMEECSVRDAALKLSDWFALASDSGKAGASGGVSKKKQKGRTKARPAKTEAPGEINPPLGFELRVDPEHEYGAKRGLTAETIGNFGAGLCLSKGMFSGRYIVPLHDEQGQLIGYAGRSIDDTEPKYLFPPGDKGFAKSRLLFGLHRLLEKKAAIPWVVVVEGVFDAMTVEQAGYPCVALLGSSLSKGQEELLCRHFDQVILLFDGDDAGRSATDDCLLRLGCRVLVKAIPLAEDQQPDMLSFEEIQQLLE